MVVLIAAVQAVGVDIVIGQIDIVVRIVVRRRVMVHLRGAVLVGGAADLGDVGNGRIGRDRRIEYQHNINRYRFTRGQAACRQISVCDRQGGLCVAVGRNEGPIRIQVGFEVQSGGDIIRHQNVVSCNEALVGHFNGEGNGIARRHIDVLRHLGQGQVEQFNGQRRDIVVVFVLSHVAVSADIVIDQEDIVVVFIGRRVDIRLRVAVLIRSAADLGCVGQR